MPHPARDAHRARPLEHPAANVLGDFRAVVGTPHQRVDGELTAAHERRHEGTGGGADDHVGVVGVPAGGHLDSHENGDLVGGPGDTAPAEDQTDPAHGP